jgi:hypothetical protein
LSRDSDRRACVAQSWPSPFGGVFDPPKWCANRPSRGSWRRFHQRDRFAGPVRIEVGNAVPQVLASAFRVSLSLSCPAHQSSEKQRHHVVKSGESKRDESESDKAGNGASLPPFLRPSAQIRGLLGAPVSAADICAARVKRLTADSAGGIDHVDLRVMDSFEQERHSAAMVPTKESWDLSLTSALMLRRTILHATADCDASRSS